MEIEIVASEIMTIQQEATVFVVDDDPAIRKSLRWLIESVGLKVQTHELASEFLESYSPEFPGCLVLDVRIPGMSGLELQEKLRERGYDIPVIIVSGYGDVPMAVRAMKAGAIDFLEKPVSDQVLLDYIQKGIETDIRNKQNRVQNQDLMERKETLTRREREVMEYVVVGFSSREIAEKLNVSFKTVEAHRAKIMKKMQAKSVPKLIQMDLQIKDVPEYDRDQ
ncbi:MAG TPA: DNA-binding response regulator [Planctomycetaceae bacterium]|nr:DNA-binding response regulator [Gimesia sp.]HBL47484.1 DNA-binding response regulator [Planctomycetaceae bacterium]|tara:strand:- start:2744 stop:3412 length:669 start_codon:yes stop_codon:yes gene_type:complete